MSLRNRLLNANGCSFRGVIHADYGDAYYTFTMDCIMDYAGNLTFEVVEPQTISGICGSVSASGGALTFDDHVLAFPVLADDQITPVTAPYVIMKALRSGYIHSAGTWEHGYHIRLDDSYQNDPLQVEVYTDSSYTPVSAEILWRGKRILSMVVDNFTFM